MISNCNCGIGENDNRGAGVMVGIDVHMMPKRSVPSLRDRCSTQEHLVLLFLTTGLHMGGPFKVASHIKIQALWASLTCMACMICGIKAS